jgi:hypothetical protein
MFMTLFFSLNIYIYAFVTNYHLRLDENWSAGLIFSDIHSLQSIFFRYAYMNVGSGKCLSQIQEVIIDPY